MKNNNKHQLALLLFPIILFCQPISAIDFVFNGFNSSSVSLYGSAVFESRILTLTNQTSFTIGRALYPKKIPTKAQNSSFVYPFSTSFIFAMAPYKNVLPGHGLVFLFVPFTGIEGASAAQHLGFLNITNDRSPNNHMLGIEFDVFSNQEFNDMNANHVGLDVNSLTSIAAADAGYWADNSRSSSSNGNSSDDDRKSFKEQKLNNGKNYQVWIDYADSLINVTMAPAGMKRPSRPLLNVSLNLSEVFEDEMYVGFTASTGQLVQSHKILAWSFSNSNFSLSERLVTTGLPSFVLPKDPFFRSKGFISGATVGGLLLVPPLVEWLWKMMMEGKLLHALDERLRARGDQFDEEEVERILHLGLLCAYPDPKVRPTMRQAVKVLEGKNELNEIEIEDMDTYLLKQMKSKDWWTDYSQSSNHGSHPTFDEIRRYQSSSMSLSWANTTMEGQAWKELNQKVAEPRFKSI
uniref:L-type lectin-domain containing receptor kinase VII.1-like isoform X2 n=1 Tax=Populus alba TaxID=43335 RepID=A0A4U5LQ64_POPAL|nr:L-type lectin-domain containing receptor kinase VII.1-like isoform X2 [Populus alba]